MEQILNVVRRLPPHDSDSISEWKEMLQEHSEVATKSQKELEAMHNISTEAFESCCGDVGVNDFTAWRDAELDKWGRRVKEASGVTPKGEFKAIDTTISAQVRATLQTGKHLQRSRRIKEPIRLYGNLGMLPAGSNDCHYDDGELYRSLLREVIESGAECR